MIKNINSSESGKFKNPRLTAKGEKRAWVNLTRLRTLWFCTGTLCNLTCENCYIESSPTNDSLAYITPDDVKVFLYEIEQDNLGTEEIGFTGGEPFMNPDIIDIMELCLSWGFKVLCLTNAMLPMMKYKSGLLELNKKYCDRLTIRISVDHYKKKLHEQERGSRSWELMLKGILWLSSNNFNIDIAGRTLWGDDEHSLRKGYASLFKKYNLNVDAFDRKQLMIFPEMDEHADVPEITTSCWKILGIHPDKVMCASSRMVIKRKGSAKPSVVACTLLPYDPQFELGSTLKEASQSVHLNHPHCARFCVLGGGSCSG